MNFASMFASLAKGADWYEEFLSTFLPSLDADIAALLGRGAVSATSFSIGTGSKAFPDLAPATIEFPTEMRVRVRRRGDPATYMLGAVSASAAGSVTVLVDAVGGSGGPYTDWLITADVAASPARMTSRAVTASGTVTSADLGGIIYCTGTDTLAFDPVATLGDAFWTVVANISGTRTLNPDGSEQIEDATTIALSANQAVVVAVVAGELRVVAAKGYGASTQASQAEQNAGTSAALASSPSTVLGASYLNVRNYVDNPEGLIWQRNNAASATDNSYYWDRWRVLAETTNVVTPSQLTSGLPTGCQNAMRLTVGSTNNKKFAWFQVFEGSDVIAHRGKGVCAAIQVQATAGITDFRMAIVEFTGTKDAVSGDPISAWNSAGTVPTLAANWAYISTGGAPANLSVTTGFSQFSVTATIGATATNIAVLIWSEDQTTTTTTDKVDLTQVMWTLGGAPPAYSPRPYAEELFRCQRFCWVWATADGNIGHGFADGNTTGTIALKFPTTMRAAPTFSVSGVTHFQVDAVSGTSGATTGLTAAAISAEAADLRPVRSGSTWTAGQGIRLLAANASAALTFTAEL